MDFDVKIINKKNFRIVSDGATIIGNGYKIIMKGDDYTYSQYNLVSGLTLVDCTLRVENSFAVTIANIVFQNCTTSIEFANTATWTEGTKIEDCHFINSIEAIAFRTPAENATGSYASSVINRCFFKLVDNSVGINIEYLAQYSDSRIENSRIWFGENGKTNQTGMRIDGAMFETTLTSVVFESFADDPVDFYGIAIGPNADPTPILGEGVTFLGNWTARVHNPSSKWISGIGSLFRRSNVNIEVGLDNEYGGTTSLHARPLTISSFKLRIQILGILSDFETITVRFRLEFVDNSISEIEKTFTDTAMDWLGDDDLLALFPSQNIVWAILMDAKSNMNSSSAIVKVDFYGETT